MTAAASMDSAPLDTAMATAACSAVSVSEGSATAAAAYVRPVSSRTAAADDADVRARVPRARVTSLASSGSRTSSGIRRLLVRRLGGALIGDPLHEDRC